MKSAFGVPRMFAYGAALAACLGAAEAAALEFVRVRIVPSNAEKPEQGDKPLNLSDRVVVGLARYAHFYIEYRGGPRGTQAIDVACSLYLPGGAKSVRFQNVRVPNLGMQRVAVPNDRKHTVEVRRPDGETGVLMGFGPFDSGSPLGAYEIECVSRDAKARGQFRLDRMNAQEIREYARPSVVRVILAGTGRVRPAGPGVRKDCEKEPGGAGTGFVIDASGLIVTNSHVAGACRAEWPTTPIFVELHDGARLPAALVGFDELSDIAVIRVRGRPLPAMRWATDLREKGGEPVVALGYPYGIAGDLTTTQGIVSAVRRSLGQHADLVQTDATVNVGNSGGPLFNTFGEVIGVNTFIVGRSGTNFAVSARVARVAAMQIIASGAATRARLGVNDGFAPPAAVRALSSFGVVVQTVAPGSPAATAGLRTCDVIEEISSQPTADLIGRQRNRIVIPIDSAGDLTNALMINFKRGQQVTLIYRRFPPSQCADVREKDERGQEQLIGKGVNAARNAAQPLSASIRLQ